MKWQVTFGAIGLILLFLSQTTLAIVVNPSDSVIPEDAEAKQAELQKQQEQLLQMIALERKIEEATATHQQNLQEAVVYLDEKISGHQIYYAIILIVVALASQGMAWAIYLHLKGRKLL